MGTSWAEGVRARVAAGRRWFLGRAAFVIGNQGAELVRAWDGAAIVICNQSAQLLRVGGGPTPGCYGALYGGSVKAVVVGDPADEATVRRTWRPGRGVGTWHPRSDLAGVWQLLCLGDVPQLLQCEVDLIDEIFFADPLALRKLFSSLKALPPAPFPAYCILLPRRGLGQRECSRCRSRRSLSLARVPATLPFAGAPGAEGYLLQADVCHWTLRGGGLPPRRGLSPLWGCHLPAELTLARRLHGCGNGPAAATLCAVGT